MPTSCAVYGCVMRFDKRATALGIKLYRIPTNYHKRRLWIHAVNRKEWVPKSTERICGRHFVSGKPSNDSDNIDYCPTKFMKGNNSSSNPVSQIKQLKAREARYRKRAAESHERECVINIAEIIIRKYVLTYF